ncbi:MAG: hydrogen gas-evolving membrane-bound hydrogenase subunit E [Oligoflexus sp.]
MVWAVCVIATLALLAPMLYTYFREKAVWIFAVSLFSVFLYFSSFLFDEAEISQLVSYAWAEEIGVMLSFKLDGLSYLFALLISFIGTGVLLYCKTYMLQYQKYGLGSFYAAILLFTAAMLGLVFSDNLLQLYIFWELTSISSYFLIGFKSTTKEARQAATKSLLVTMAGGLCLLVAIIFLSLASQDYHLSLAESFQISEVSTLNLSEHELYPWIVIFLLGAVLTKSAQFPFYFWLPSAMYGPTPVSSYLHSATMVKAGIFLMAKFYPFLANHIFWNVSVTSFGLLTMVIGATLTLAYRDMKKILAYSTIFVLGVLMMLLGIGTEAAIQAAVVYLIAHAFYKVALFQVVGNVDYATGSRDVTKVFGLAKIMPLTAIAAMLAAFSQAGMPPFLGFYGKDLLYAASLDSSNTSYWIIILTFSSSVLIAGVSFGILYFPFWQNKNEITDDYRKLPLTMTAPPLVFAICGLLFGLFPGLLDAKLSSSIASAIYGSELQLDLKLWHGLDANAVTVLLLSFLTLLLGIFVAFRLFSISASLSSQIEKYGRFDPDQIYEYLMSRMLTISHHVTSFFQTGSLSHYLRMMLLGLIFMMAYPAWLFMQDFPDLTMIIGDIIDSSILLLGGGAALAAMAFRRHLQMLAILVAIGLVMIFIFSIYSAPDLALTLTMVETLSVVLIILVFRLLPKKSMSIVGINRWIHAFCAVTCGIGLSLFLIFRPHGADKAASVFYIEKSFPEAFGLNVVNVILVDFRSLDTLGEVLAVAIAAIAVYGLLKRKNSKYGKGNSSR